MSSRRAVSERCVDSMTERERQRYIRRKKENRKRMRKKRMILGVAVLSISCILSFSIGIIVGAKGIEDRSERAENIDTQVTAEARNAGPDEKEADAESRKDRNPESAGSASWTETKAPDVSVGIWAESTGERKEILLVNKDNPLPGDYEVELKILQDGVNKAAKEAYEPLCEMLRAGRKEGLQFEICSSYRDVDRQRELFEEDLEALIRRGYSYQEAYTEVAKETMPPGYSEHSTGLAFDIVALSYQMLDDGQEKTAENKWLQEHCAEYGFILRYPEDKEEITGISYESWHFRYVGVEAAEFIMEEGITLEEYLEEDSDPGENGKSV